ncbi:MAG: nucleotide exchange factor GrpE [Chlorobium sp.]|uniref:nucleotide exchange factor GrpE n=1 Tax=Chlorobium sp. TaxID=1095 RepID=UPI0025BC30B8|nr:nucleotide exchange factor GrpE [Chlorobium sp.]MCF8382673.1 nucleotide exchange factor GrpE [Chlorobium sp.]
MRKKASAGQDIHPENVGEPAAAGSVSSGASGIDETVPVTVPAEEAEARKRVAELEAELSVQKEQLDKLRDELLRRAADFENFRKVKEREAMAAGTKALENTIRELLPFVDDIKRVLSNAPRILEITAEAKPYVEGVELLKRNFDNWLAGKGVTEIRSIGMKLDVEYHEAISMIEIPDTEPETIVEEYQTGYLLGERVIRHARVIVAG